MKTDEQIRALLSDPRSQSLSEDGKSFEDELDDKTIIHSDQGFHYPSLAFVKKLQDHSFIQSMSRKGNCWNNAPQENFFGHMKDEIKEVIKESNTFDEVNEILRDWIDYYNKDRYQWELERLSPAEYYLYQQTGIYPLNKGKPKNKLEQRKDK